MEILSLDHIKKLIKDVSDFPKPGIIFKDITPVLETKNAFQSLIEHLAKHVSLETTKLVAIESRGFILGSALSVKTGIPFCLVRKKGKLPRPTHSISYELEYGQDQLFIHKDSLKPNDNVLIIDDVLATGGTAHAVENLCLLSDVKSISSLFFIELDFLSGDQKIKHPHKSLIHY